MLAVRVTSLVADQAIRHGDGLMLEGAHRARGPKAAAISKANLRDGHRFRRGGVERPVVEEIDVIAAGIRINPDVGGAPQGRLRRRFGSAKSASRSPEK